MENNNNDNTNWLRTPPATSEKFWGSTSSSSMKLASSSAIKNQEFLGVNVKYGKETGMNGVLGFKDGSMKWCGERTDPSRPVLGEVKDMGNRSTLHNLSNNQVNIPNWVVVYSLQSILKISTPNDSVRFYLQESRRSTIVFLDSRADPVLCSYNEFQTL